MLVTFVTRKRAFKQLRHYSMINNYFFLFRMKENTVEIVAMFHGLEDFESKLLW